MPHSVAAIFQNESQANQAQSELINLGIPSGSISVQSGSGQGQGAGSKRISVDAPTADQAERVADLMQRLGAQDILREADTRTEQLAAQEKHPHHGPRLETTDDDPFIGQSSDKQQK